MSDIGSTLRRRWVEVAWGVFAAANLVVIAMLSHWETIPFHFIWVSLTLVYGIRLWRLRTTMVLLVVVMAVTGAALAWSIARGHESPDELAEVPLMAAMFVAMVWHAERRRTATEEAGRLAESEHLLLLGQREFVRDASHELRTPITVARGHAELIRDSGLNGQVSKDAEVILDELGHLSSLSERLLVLTTAGHPGFLTMGSVAGGAVRRGVGAPVGADGCARLEGGDHGARNDPRRSRATGDRPRRGAGERGQSDGRRGHDPCRVSAGQGRLVIEVTDQGRGIRAEDLPRIFDRFTRVETDRARSNGGTGLGLSITKAIVEAHGGSIEVESEEGRGTTFQVVLDAFRPAPVPKAPR